MQDLSEWFFTNSFTHSRLKLNEVEVNKLIDPSDIHQKNEKMTQSIDHPLTQSEHSYLN